MKKYFVNSYILILIIIIFGSVTLFSTANYKEEATETALSLCSSVIKSDDDIDVKVKMMRNLLTFADLSSECKENLIACIKNSNSNHEEISNFLEFFEYSKKNIEKLEELVTPADAVSAVKIFNSITSEELAEKLIKDVYSGVTFQKQIGNGKEYLVRYYCSNICIDACENGKVKYLCDVTSNSLAVDIFQKWLVREETIKVIYSTKNNGIECKEIEGNNINATLYINSENERIFAAEIRIKYYEQ